MPKDVSAITQVGAVKAGEEWDFYPCRVDDGPASILLNLWFRKNRQVLHADYLHWCEIDMLEPGEHGMGVGEDVESLHRIEDAIVESVQNAGLFYVGRLRNHGMWQLTFYGEKELESTLREIVATAIPDGSPRDFAVGSKKDTDWSYYFEFLCPDAERWQWMKDRRVVQRLQQNGDLLTNLRRVEHFVQFQSENARDQFVEQVVLQGFEVDDTYEHSDSDRPFAVQISRIDSVQLNDIHELVMTLVQTAKEMGGLYDGWGTLVQKQ